MSIHICGHDRNCILRNPTGKYIFSCHPVFSLYMSALTDSNHVRCVQKNSMLKPCCIFFQKIKHLMRLPESLKFCIGHGFHIRSICMRRRKSSIFRFFVFYPYFYCAFFILISDLLFFMLYFLFFLVGISTFIPASFTIPCFQVPVFLS